MLGEEKPVTKGHMLYDCIYYDMARRDKSIKTDSRSGL